MEADYALWHREYCTKITEFLRFRNVIRTIGIQYEKKLIIITFVAHTGVCAALELLLRKMAGMAGAK